MIGTKKKIYTRKLSCQFLLGTVQLAVAKVTEYMEELGWEIVSIPLRYGTTRGDKVEICKRYRFYVSIPLRYGTTAVFSYYY